MLDALQDAARWFATFAAIFLAASFVAHLSVASLSRDRLRAAMAGAPWRSTVAALVLGAITPFCTCSTVPLVAAMHASGVPSVATTAFLIVSPLVNPATVALVAALAGPAMAFGFVLMSLLLALSVALALGLLGISPKTVDAGAAFDGPTRAQQWLVRTRQAAAATLRDLGRLTPVLLGVALLGALLPANVDVGAVGRALEDAGPLAVPLAVVVGVPVYASTALLLPLGAALLAGGASLGVVSAFLIGATGLSVPEGVLLYRLLGGRYLRALVAAFVLATVALGYVVDALMTVSGPALLAAVRP